jgi:hypothetical protein
VALLPVLLAGRLIGVESNHGETRLGSRQFMGEMVSVGHLWKSVNIEWQFIWTC